MSVRLFAVVPADDAASVRERATRLSCLQVESLAAAFETAAEGAGQIRAALRHDRVVGRLLDLCSSVVPFRIGIAFSSEAQLRSVLLENLGHLDRQLDRFRGRVEMGLKARLAADRAPGTLLRLPFGLDRVRALTPAVEDRQERVSQRAGVTLLEGAYLVRRRAIEEYWSALDAIRCLAPELPLVGSGPWAPYSFCSRPLQRGVSCNLS